jgi:hypothetical protein
MEEEKSALLARKLAPTVPPRQPSHKVVPGFPPFWKS